MKKQIIGTTFFLVLLCILFILVRTILWLPPTPISYFYEEPKDSIDVVYIGASNAYAHFNTVLAYKLYGFTTGMLSADSQEFSLTKYLIKEASKYQKPSLYIVDIARLANDFNSNEDIRRTTDSMKFSNNRIEAIKYALSYRKNVKTTDYINFVFSFLMYHNRYKDLSIQDFNVSERLYKGYLFSEYNAKTEPLEEYIWSENMQPLQAQNKEVLIDLLNYIKNNDINILFVVPKRHYTEENNERLNYAIKIIKDNGFNVINFNTLQELKNIDFQTDFYNNGHLNVYGATKYTLYFGEYLMKNYYLNNNNKYESWESEYNRFKESFARITKQDFEKYLTIIDNK